MADVEQPPIKVTVKVINAKGLYGVKGNNLVTIAKVEYGSVKLGESAKIQVESGNAQLDFTCTLHLKLLDPLVLNEMAQTNIYVTFIEVLPKEKKSKEEKSVELSQCCVDLLPLLKGEVEFTVNSNIHMTHQVEDSPQQTCGVAEIFVSVAKPLLNSAQLQMSNILTLCVESAFSIPETWCQMAANYKYAGCMPIPITTDNETFLVFSSGLFKGPMEKEINSQKKSFIPNVSECNTKIQNKQASKIVYEEDNGDLKSPDDFKFRMDVELNKPSVAWNAEQRCFLSAVSLENLRQLIACNRYLPFEIIRTVDSSAVKPKSKDEECSYTYHGIAYVDLAPLLYPGVQCIHGAYLVHPYTENEALKKLKRKGVFNDEFVKKMINVESINNSLGTSKSSKQGKQDSKNKISSPNGSSEGGDVVHDSQQYQDSKTYIVLGLKLDKPLVKKRLLEDIIERVAEILPPRPKFEKVVGGSKKAIEDYEKQVENISDLLLEEFRSMFGTVLSDVPEEVDERQKIFFHYLNTSGKYNSFKEHLKYYIVKLVREKFGHKSNFKRSDDYQAFLSQLYQFLMDHANLSLNKYLSKEELQKVPSSFVDLKQLLHFAKESEIMLNFELAEKYYKECVARNKNDLSSWMEYGSFCMKLQDIQRAEQCFREVVAIDQQSLKGLLLNASIHLIQEEYNVAEELFDAATHYHPNNILSWTLLGLFYLTVNNSILAERSIIEANKLLDKIVHADFAEDHETKVMKNFPSIFMIAANFYLERNFFQMAEKALAHELVTIKQGPRHQYYMLLAQFQIQKKIFSFAFDSIEEALVLHFENPNAWALKGHVKYLENCFEEALTYYERSLAYVEQTNDLHCVLMRLAAIYLHRKKDYHRAKSTYLQLCKSWPSCITWLGVGIASYKLEETLEAEQALNEANILDNMNPDVWSYLTLVCLKCNRLTEAEQCYKYSCKLGFSYDDAELESIVKDGVLLANLDI
nr:cilia- and flagella-associated protein 70-like isoform X2 [Hydra vulgaris]